MKLINRKLELALAGKKYLNSVVKSFYLDVDNRCLVATDGIILARVDVTIEPGDVSGLIPKEALTDARRLATGRLVDRVLSIDASDEKVVTLSNGKQYPRDNHKYPNYSQLFPEYESEPVTCILNTKRLYELAQALSKDDRVELTFDPTDKRRAITVRPIRPADKDNAGLIMPVAKSPRSTK